MSNDKELKIFPTEMFGKITTTRFYTIEASDIKTDDDLEVLIKLLFNYPERDFFYFQEKEDESNSLIQKAIDNNCILANEWEFNFYKHPKYKKDFIKIEKKNNKYSWNWEKKVAEKTSMFIRFKLQLSEMQNRKLEIQEKINLEKESESTNPLILKPSIWGLGIDLEKLPRWAKKLYEKLNN